MIFDVAVPQGNEKELVKAAESYGLDRLYLLYDNQKSRNQKISVKIESSVEVIEALVACDIKDIPKSCMWPVFFDFSKTPYRQDIFSKIDFAFNLELFIGKDHLKTYESALDDATAKIAKQHNVGIIFNLDILSDKRDSRILSRALQNRAVAKRYNLAYSVCSFARDVLTLRNPKDMGAFEEIFF